LHKYGLVHRDIAARNILIGKLKYNRIDSSTEIRISDFGMSRSLTYYNDDSESKNTEAFGRTKTNFGPLKWMAPESISKFQYSEKSDVYMFGITMWEIFNGGEPYPNIAIVNVGIKVVTENMRPPLDSKMSDEFANLIKSCWEPKPESRPTFQQVYLHLNDLQMNPIHRLP